VVHFFGSTRESTALHQRVRQAFLGNISGYWGWLLLLAGLAALPVFLHGCHGDEDNELLTVIAQARR
jgi:hypothetical protein